MFKYRVNMNLFYSDRFCDYVLKRSSNAHVRYLHVFYNIPQHYYVVRQIHVLVLTYIADQVYEQRRFRLCRQLTCPGSVIVIMYNLQEKWTIRRYPRLIVLRCLENLADQEFITERFVKISVAIHKISQGLARVVRFQGSKLYVDEHCYDLNHVILNDDYNFARRIHMA